MDNSFARYWDGVKLLSWPAQGEFSVPSEQGAVTTPAHHCLSLRPVLAAVGAHGEKLDDTSLDAVQSVVILIEPCRVDEGDGIGVELLRVRRLPLRRTLNHDSGGVSDKHLKM